MDVQTLTLGSPVRASGQYHHENPVLGYTVASPTKKIHFLDAQSQISPKDVDIIDLGGMSSMY